MKYPKTKIQISDIFDIFVSYSKFNKNGIYKQFIILSSISQLIRGKTHYKNNFINYIKKFGKYVFLLLRLLFFYRIKIRFKKDKALKTKCDLLIIYPNSDKWILKGLSNDLAREIKKLACNVETDEIRNIKKYDAKHIFFSHHNLAIPTIIKNPEYINKSSTYISHLRTISNIEIEILNKFQNIFCQSEKDKMRLNSFGFLPGRVLYLPIGYDDKLFYKYKNYQDRKYDFILSFPLKINSLGSHYWLRKSSVLLHETISKLALKDFKVMIIGDNWDKSLLSNNINIDIQNIDYFNKNKILNNAKIFLNLSLLEGGPVTIIEALASGCKVITKDNGNGFNLSLDFPNLCFRIKNTLCAQDLSQEIIEIYKKENTNFNNQFSEVLKEQYSFKSLSKTIIKHI